MTYDIFAVSDDARYTLRRNAAGDPRELAAAAQTEADEWRRGARVVVVPSGTMPGEPQPTREIEL